MAAEHDESVATARRKKKTVRSEVQGVYRLQHGNYRARIWDPSRRATRHLGAFSTAEDAARAYDAAAVRLHGAPTALTYFRQHTADGGGVHVSSCVDKDAKANDGGDAPPPLLQASCVDKGAAAESSCPGQRAAESAKKRSVARTVLRRVRGKPSGMYMAKIVKRPKVVGARRFLGGFSTAEDAARAYVASAVKLHAAIGLKMTHMVGEVGCKGQGQGQAGGMAAAAAAKSKPNSTAGFRGVCLKGSGKKYSARIWDPAQRARLFLGTFDTAEDAVRAYDTAAVKVHGAKAKTNFKQPPMAAAAVDAGEESRMDLNDFPELHGVSATTNFKPPVAAAADDAESSPMDITTNNDFPELPALDLFSGTIAAGAQLDDVFTDLPPLDLQQVDELLKDMDFAEMMA